MVRSFNMEEIAEQSYDLMEAYMLAKEKANEKLEAASQRQHEVQKKFAVTHNINLIENTDEMSAKMKTADLVMKHYQEVYLIFFKSYKQEAYLMDAVNNKNINGVEQNMNSLQTFSEDGLEKLKELKAYNNDESLSNNRTNCLIKDRNGTYWLGTFGSGLCYFTINPKFKHIIIDTSLNAEDRIVYGLKTLHSGRILVSTMSQKYFMIERFGEQYSNRYKFGYKCSNKYSIRYRLISC